MRAHLARIREKSERQVEIKIAEAPEEAREKGMKLWWWDFVFYATFGLIVTSSVKVAGVLLVFAFLIIPSVAAMTSVEGTSRRIMFGWLFGIVGCFFGLEMSLRLDWSTGPTIVAAFLVLLIGVWLTRTVYAIVGKPAA